MAEAPNTTPVRIEQTELDNDAMHRKIAGIVHDEMHPLQERHYDSYKAYTAILFTALALLVGILGILSRIEVRDQVKDMQSRFDKQESDMKKNFELLAGESLKRPNIELLHEGKPLASQSVQIRYHKHSSPNDATLDTIFMRNSGDKRTEPIAMRISIGADVNLNPRNTGQRWEKTTTSDKNYAASFYSSQYVMVHPGETFSVHPLYLDWDMNTLMTNTSCKLDVFYGDAKPAEALFHVVFIPQ